MIEAFALTLYFDFGLSGGLAVNDGCWKNRSWSVKAAHPLLTQQMCA